MLAIAIITPVVCVCVCACVYVHVCVSVCAPVSTQASFRISLELAQWLGHEGVTHCGSSLHLSSIVYCVCIMSTMSTKGWDLAYVVISILATLVYSKNRCVHEYLTHGVIKL